MATWHETAVDFKDPPRVRDPEVLKRFHEAGHLCLVCLWHRVDAHHLLLRSQSGDDVLANLIPLCSSCHEALHLGIVLPRDTIGRYILSERGTEALSYLRSKRSDGWIEKRFGVEL